MDVLCQMAENSQNTDNGREIDELLENAVFLEVGRPDIRKTMEARDALNRLFENNTEDEALNVRPSDHLVMKSEAVRIASQIAKIYGPTIKTGDLVSSENYIPIFEIRQLHELLQAREAEEMRLQLEQRMANRLIRELIL